MFGINTINVVAKIVVEFGINGLGAFVWAFWYKWHFKKCVENLKKYGFLCIVYILYAIIKAVKEMNLCIIMNLKMN